MKLRFLFFGILYLSGGCLVGVEGGEKEGISKWVLKIISKFDNTLVSDNCYGKKSE